MSDKTTLFTGSDHAKLYAQYRPTYPPELIEGIIDYCKDSGAGFDLAVDVACGSGQSTVPLAKYFKKVIGTDISQAQIDNAPKLDNVIFRVSPGEKFDGIESESVDLITCAAGAHWLDLEKFYTEARRVLKKNGVVCFYCYTTIRLDLQEATDVFWKFFYGDLEPYWAEGRKVAHGNYKDIHLPFNDYHRVNDKYKIVQRMPLKGLMGVATSYSSYQTLLKNHPETDILHKLQSKLEEIYCAAKGVKKEDIEITATYDVFMLLGRK